MTQKDLTSAIAGNTYLSEKEKSFWSGMLPRMNDAQRARFDEILIRANAINWESPVQAIVALTMNSILGSKTA